MLTSFDVTKKVRSGLPTCLKKDVKCYLLEDLRRSEALDMLKPESVIGVAPESHRCQLPETLTSAAGALFFCEERLLGQTKIERDFFPSSNF